MIFFRYLTRLFWMHLLAICLATIMMIAIFEFLTLSPGADYSELLMKIPFSFHKLLPFITFVSMLMFTWTLIGHHEWVALSSIGRSPWQIIRVPLFWVAIMGLFDLFYVAPLGQKFFNPFEGKKTEIALNSGGWQKGITHRGYVFFRHTTPQCNLIELNNRSLLIRHIVATGMSFQDQSIICHNAWDLQAHSTPIKKQSIIIALAKPIVVNAKNMHPLLFSLAQVQSEIAQANPSMLISVRLHYWWSHFFWALALIPLAPALLIGSSNRYWKMLCTALGMIGALTLYLFKEWMYAISIPLSHTWPHFLLWIPVFVTIGLAWGLFFEKKEL